MRRGSRFLVGLAAAALTYGSLMAFVGPNHAGYGRFHHRYAARGDWHSGCDGADRGDWHRSHDRERLPASNPNDSLR